jgi:hypothetical protein
VSPRILLTGGGVEPERDGGNIAMFIQRLGNSRMEETTCLDFQAFF